MSPTNNPSLHWLVLSRILGWSYFLAWSASFYPQPIHNLRRRSVAGSTIDFPYANIFGLAAYTISTACLLFSPVIREEYALRHGHGGDVRRTAEPAVRINDFAFALHGLALATVVYTQFWPRLWGWKSDTDDPKHPGARASMAVRACCLGGAGAVVCILLVVASGIAKGNRVSRDRADGWAWLDIYALGYLKLFLTVIKFLPQIALNFHLKSTHGWSIWQILLDLYGGIASLMQLLIDAGLQQDHHTNTLAGVGGDGYWKAVFGNPAKLGLALIAFGIDATFLVQHFVLYGRGKERAAVVEEEQDVEEEQEAEGSERAPLLRGEN